MFIHGFEGSWMSHPFWRRKFLLTDPCDLAVLQTCDVAVLIDEAKGCGIAPEPRAPAPPPPPAPRASRPPVEPRWARPAPMARPYNVKDDPEFARAQEITGHAKRAVRRLFGEVRLGKAVDARAVLPVVEAVAASVERNPQAMIGVSRLKSKDEYTYLHSVAVCALMVNLARRLGMGEAEQHRAGLAGLLHDVGKLAIPSAILNKPGALTDDEFETVRSHPEAGHATLLAGIDVPAEALDVCRHHHEKVDGTGYPFGLNGSQLSIHARMGAICDVYDALTSNRVYKVGWTPSEAVSAMHGWTGHFDPDLLFRFYRSIGIFPVGLLVRLRTNRLAVVLDNGRRHTRQKVRAFYAIGEREMVTAQDVELADTLAGDQIVAAENPAAWALGDWDRLRTRLIGGVKAAA